MNVFGFVSHGSDSFEATRKKAAIGKFCEGLGLVLKEHRVGYREWLSPCTYKPLLNRAKKGVSEGYDGVVVYSIWDFYYEPWGVLQGMRVFENFRVPVWFVSEGVSMYSGDGFEVGSFSAEYELLKRVMAERVRLMKVRAGEIELESGARMYQREVFNVVKNALEEEQDFLVTHKEYPEIRAFLEKGFDVETVSEMTGVELKKVKQMRTRYNRRCLI